MLPLMKRRIGLGISFAGGLFLEWVIIVRHWDPLWYLVSAGIFAVSYVIFGLHHTE